MILDNLLYIFIFCQYYITYEFYFFGTRAGMIQSQHVHSWQSSSNMALSGPQSSKWQTRWTNCQLCEQMGCTFSHLLTATSCYHISGLVCRQGKLCTCLLVGPTKMTRQYSENKSLKCHPSEVLHPWSFLSSTKTFSGRKSSGHACMHVRTHIHT